MIRDNLNKKFCTADQMQKYVDDLVEMETNKLHERVTMTAGAQQDQLDDIFYNHLAIPGLINAKPDIDDPLNTS